jgi:hypothetical protein
MNTFKENTKLQTAELQVRKSGTTSSMGRLDFIKKLALLTGAIVSGCTPARILLNSYPDMYDDDERLCRQILAAFVLTVIPGADPDDPDLYRIFNDEYYPFHKFCGFFTSDLCSKSKNLFGIDKFFKLSFDQRTQVIQAGLEDDSTTSRLYNAAIYITQVSYYGCIYNAEKSCELIDYQGSYGFMDTEMYHKDYNNILAYEITLSGNYS